VIRGAGKFEIIVGEELVHSKATDRFPSYPDKACSYVKVYDAILKKGAEKKKRSEQQPLDRKYHKVEAREISSSSDGIKDPRCGAQHVFERKPESQNIFQRKIKAPLSKKIKPPSKSTSKSPSQRKFSSSRKLGSIKVSKSKS